jgi:hypothetical protein
MSTALLAMLGMHVLGDYYLQTDRLAQARQHQFSAVVLHSLLYSLAFLPLLLASHPSAFVVLAVSHALLQKGTNKTAILFMLDQLCHILLLVVVSILYHVTFFLPPSWVSVLRISVLLLCAAKPVSVMFTELFGRFRPMPGEGTEGAGKVIGYLERLILVILMVVGEYGVIGWIIAAKTFARSRQLADSQAFCEYFLVGTLLSILSSISLYLVLYRW